MTILAIAVFWHPARLLFHFGAFNWHLFVIGTIASIFTLLILVAVKSLFFKQNRIA